MTTPSASDTSMETGASTEVTTERPKRVIVDANNTNIEVVDAKKPRVPQEPVKKAKVIRFIALAHKRILHAMGLKDYWNNISLGDQIHNILFTAYTVIRQFYNKTGGTLAGKLENTTYKVTNMGTDYSLDRETVSRIVIDSAKAVGLEFKEYRPKDEENWYGLASPLLNFLSGHSLRRKELRLGHHYMTVERRSGQEKAVQLSQYGIYGCHHVLCEGITFPPEKRSSMPQSLGPMAALICYIKAERKYSEKWAQACKRAMAHFPDIDTVLSVIRDKDPADIRSLVSLVADICLLVTTRQATRMFPSPAVFSKIFTEETHRVGGSVVKTSNILEFFDFSGKGACFFYKTACAYDWSMNLKSGNDNIAKQIFFHSTFGTYKEDLGILSSITNLGTWLNREEMGRVFQGCNTEGTSVTFRPVQLVYFSKLAQANQTGKLTNSYTQLSSYPCFSGRTKRKFDDAFFDHMAEATNRGMGGKSLPALIASYTLLRDELRKELEKEGRTMTMGTTQWFKVDTLTATQEPDIAVDYIPNATGKFFLGKK